MADTPTKTKAPEPETKETVITPDEQPIKIENPPRIIDQSPDAPKVSLKTSGAFLLQDPFTGHLFEQTVAVETVITSFVQERMDNGELVKA